jgi:FkbM family methyltransferase
MNSLTTLYNAPYNKDRPVFAMYRYLYWKMIRLLKLKNVRFRFWGDRTLTLDYDSLQSMWIMYNYLIDWEEFNLIRSYIRPGDHVLDIGSNIGTYSLWMSKFVGPNGKVHCFEPDRQNFDKLEANILGNNLDGIVQANNIGLSDTDGVLSFTTGLDKENHISRETVPGTVPIRVQQLDTYIQQNRIAGIAYMKIDVEGFEYSVLKGAGRLLSDHKVGIIQIEINDTIRNSGSTIPDLLGILTQYNYTLCSYDVKAKKLTPVDYSKEMENYFAVHDLAGANQKLTSPL